MRSSLWVLGAVLTATVGVIVLIALLLGSLGSNDEGEGSDSEPLTIVTADGEVHRLEVEVADTPEERSVGLSNRPEVPDDTGMLFIIPQRGPGFWMKDTLVDLSVAFLGRCGEIVDIQDMQAQTLDLHNTDADYSFGLETPLGWFAENGIETGDLVSIPRDHRPDGC